MQPESNLLLETVSALRHWIDNRSKQDAELKLILTNIEANIRQILNNENLNQPDPISQLPPSNGDAIITQVSPEKIAELQSKWSPETVVSANNSFTSTFFSGNVSRENVVSYSLHSLPDSERIKQIASCLALKADAFCLQYDRIESPEAPTEQAKNLLINKANAIGTRLWIFDIAPVLCSSYPEQIADLGALFTVCSESCVPLIDLLEDTEFQQDHAFDDYLKDSLALIAEAQSMLRTMLERVNFAYEDPDQKQLFTIVRDVTGLRQIYITRYMKTKDQADPSLWRALRTRVQEFTKKIEIKRFQRYIKHLQQQAVKRSLGQISHHINRIRTDGGVEHDWQRIEDALKKWSESGLPTNDERLRDKLSPIAAFLPDRLGSESQQLIRAYLQSWEIDDEEYESDEVITNNQDKNWNNPDIQRVAEWLHGRTIVLIGGEERPPAKAALINAFDLEDVIWISTRPHETLEVFKTSIRRQEVGLVMLAIRWASHAYGNISTFCRQLEKPFIRLPAGYNPRRVAHEIINQASHTFELNL
ncbi:hypothetical protein TI04_03060 [Achromatium sp. WMS2]|nr:hypothetical protein TI04_03060 [Achromatium sp. WMS2]